MSFSIISSTGSPATNTQVRGAAVKNTPPKSQNKICVETMSADEALQTLGFNGNLTRNQFFDVQSKDFRKNLFDMVFNFARRHRPNLEGVPMQQWRDKYTTNFNHIENYVKKIYQKPAKQQRDLYSAMQIANVLAQTEPDKYRQSVEGMLQKPETAANFITQHSSALQPLANKAQQMPTWRTQIQPMMHMGLLTSQEALSFLTKPSEATRKKLTDLNTMIQQEPQKPRVLLFWNSREGAVGNTSPETSEENAELTEKLKNYWQKKGADVIIVDGSGGADGRTIDAAKLMATMKPSGVITGGGPDVTSVDPFVTNLEKMIKTCNQHDVPYYGECLGHQLTGMIHSKTARDYRKYVGTVPNRAQHSPNNLSTLNTQKMEDHHALYKGALADLLKMRENKRYQGEVVAALKGYCIHNNHVNDKKPLEKRVHVVARALDNVPEIITRQQHDGKRRIIGTQFHPSKFTVPTPELVGATAQDKEFSLAILDSVFQDMQKHHATHYVGNASQNRLVQHLAGVGHKV